MKDIKEIKGYPSYMITNEGEVYSLLVNRFLTNNSNRGYCQVWLKNPDGVCKWHYIHRLVADHFVDKPVTDEVLWVNHEDGNKANNHVSNLTWTTISENIQHSVDTGLRKTTRGADNPRYGKKYPGIGGAICKWRYILPDIGGMTYKQLRTVFPNDLNNIMYKCEKGKDGFSREKIE